MDEAVNRYAREIIEAINAALANDPAVRACRERARAAGFELEVSLEAAVGFKNRGRVGTPDGAPVASTRIPPARRLTPAPRAYDITAADRRFLRSLRITAEETTEPTA